MLLILNREWVAVDGTTGKAVGIPAGTYEVERIANPLGHAAPWLTLKGTLIGGCEGYWRDWPGPADDEFTVRVLDGPT
jgi:hypothetical protein